MVPVYDRKNTDRLLGYHPKWPLGDRFHRISVIPPLRVTAAYDPNDLMQCSVDYRSVELTRDYRYSDYGWKAEAIIVTDATLQDLMMLRDFRLPGESARAAEERRYIQAYL
jgi:hypothetical protein